MIEKMFFLLFVLFCITNIENASAITIDIVPTSQSVQTGDAFFMNVVVSGWSAANEIDVDRINGIAARQKEYFKTRELPYKERLCSNVGHPHPSPLPQGGCRKTRFYTRSVRNAHKKFDTFSNHNVRTAQATANKTCLTTSSQERVLNNTVCDTHEPR
jgi:hypothetical protein